MKNFNITVLSPFNGVVILGIAAVWVMRYITDADFRTKLLWLVYVCILVGVVGDFLHHIIKNNAEKKKNKALLELEVENNKILLEKEKIRRQAKWKNGK